MDELETSQSPREDRSATVRWLAVLAVGMIVAVVGFSLPVVRFDQVAFEYHDGEDGRFLQPATLESDRAASAAGVTVRRTLTVADGFPARYADEVLLSIWRRPERADGITDQRVLVDVRPLLEWVPAADSRSEAALPAGRNARVSTVAVRGTRDGHIIPSRLAAWVGVLLAVVAIVRLVQDPLRRSRALIREILSRQPEVVPHCWSCGYHKPWGDRCSECGAVGYAVEAASDADGPGPVFEVVAGPGESGSIR